MAIFSDNENIQQQLKTDKNQKSENLESKEIGYDRAFENNIRPQTLEEYIGQTALKSTLKISIEASQKRNKQIDHMLFYGPPGLGKTTLASVIANELKTKIKITSAPALERPRDIIGILMSLKNGEILFIDEIHRLNKVTEEILYPAMEDFFLDMTTGKAQTVKTLRVPLPKFTLIGATTKAGSISSPLRDRFGVLARLELYSTEELATIVKRSADILKIDIDKDAILEIGKRSRGTPRIANRILKRVRDYAQVKGSGKIDIDMAKQALKLMDIDELGLDYIDRRILQNILVKFNGGPVGLDTLAAATGEEAGTIEDVYEPYLIQLGFIARTPRGRIALAPAYKHLNVDLSEEKQKMLNNLQKGTSDGLN